MTKFLHLHDEEARSVLINVNQISTVQPNEEEGSCITLMNDDTIDVQQDVDTILEAIHDVLYLGHVVA